MLLIIDCKKSSARAWLSTESCRDILTRSLCVHDYAGTKLNLICLLLLNTKTEENLRKYSELHDLGTLLYIPSTTNSSNCDVLYQPIP